MASYNTAEAEFSPITSNLSQSPTRRDFVEIVAGIAVGSVLDIGGVYAITHPEAALLDFNLAMTDLHAPEAPLAVTSEASCSVQRVERLYNTLITNFGTRNGMFLDNNRDSNSLSEWQYASAWSFGAARRAIGAARAMPGQICQDATNRYTQTVDLQEEYWYDGPIGYDPGYLPGPRAYHDYSQRYLDDNAWNGNGHIDDYAIFKRPLSLTRSKQIVTLGTNQWDMRYGGGMPWRQRIDGDITSRVLVANAPMAQLMLKLFMLTKDKVYYRQSRTGSPDAEVIIDWVDDNLRASNGLYLDGIGIDGSKDPHQWTYGIGSVIGAKSLLNKLNPQKYPLGETVEAATISLNSFNGASALLYPYIAYDNIQDNAFNAIYFTEIFNLIGEHNLSARHPFVHLATERLQECTDQLIDNQPYPNLLQQAGAVELAVLGALRLPESKYTIF